jgi:hypothetical protein
MRVPVARLVANRTKDQNPDQGLQKYYRPTFKKWAKYLSLTIDLDVSYKKQLVL